MNEKNLSDFTKLCQDEQTPKRHYHCKVERCNSVTKNLVNFQAHVRGKHGFGDWSNFVIIHQVPVLGQLEMFPEMSRCSTQNPVLEGAMVA